MSNTRRVNVWSGKRITYTTSGLSVEQSRRRDRARTARQAAAPRAAEPQHDTIRAGAQSLARPVLMRRRAGQSSASRRRSA